MIVVDTNVIAYLLIEGPHTQAARRVLASDSDWRLPSLWRHEFLNTLATFTRQGGITLARARRLWQTAVERLVPCEEPVDLELALRLAVEGGISAYDAQFIALAQTLGVACVTEDQRLRRAFPEETRPMETFS